MRVHFPLFAVLLLAHLSLLSQSCKTIILNDNFNSASGWNINGTNINISSGTCNFTGTSSSFDNRVHRNLNTAVSNTYCKAECSLLLGPNPAGRGAGAVVMALTAGNLDFMGYDAAQNYAETNQDGLGIVLFSSNASDNNVNHWTFVLEGKKGNVRSICPTSIYLQAVVSNYYIRMERTSANAVKLSIFTDAGFSTHLTGSPVTFAVDPAITGLNTIQHGAITPGNGNRYLNGSIDNSMVCDDSGNIVATGINGQAAPVKTLNIYPNPLSTQAIVSLQDGTAIAGVQLLDITGKELSGHVTLQATSAIIERQELPVGIYFIKVLSKNGNSSFQKLVIE